MTSDLIPLCVECAHCEVSPRHGFRCLAMTGMPNPVNGDPIVAADCGMMRLGCDCGREGKLFRARGDKQ